MDGIKILDCTLREAPLDDLMWGDLSIQKVIHGLENSGVDIIEVGFLKNNPYQFGSTSFNRVEDIKPFLKNKKENTMYVALVDYGRYDLKYLSDYDGTSIDAIRVCFKHNEIDVVLDYVAKIRAKGYKVSIQHVDTMGFTDEDIVNFIKKVNDFKPFSYAIVDTFGAMYGSEVRHYAELVSTYLDEDILLGFHAHNNLMLADANDQLFIEIMKGKRSIIVDTSLYGCGRSAGNAHTELILQYLNKKHSGSYDINEVLDLIDTVIVAAQEKTSWGYSIPYFISGIYNAHTFNVKQLLKRHNLKSKDLRGIIEMLDDTQKKAYDYALLEKLYVEYFNASINDDDVICKLSEELSGKNILLIGPGKSILNSKGKIDEYIRINKSIVIGVNNLIDGFKFDYVFYSGAVRYQNLQYQDYKSAGSPQIILSSNIKDKADDNEVIVDYKSLIKFGWINLDSSLIMLLRLLLKCGVTSMAAAGLDGYEKFGKAFYKNELDTGLDEKARLEHTNDNISMIEDLRSQYSEFKISFLTDSVYEKCFRG
ncbi:MAG: hypothetical protein IJ706_05920 [Clostridia bacterium]|nr:hypothetical protein [Clostridia bacterium]